MNGIEELSILLEELLEQKVSCKQFSSSINNCSFEKLSNVFANLHHYLDDEDIRLKDEEYKAMQDNELIKLITHLKNNNIEAANGITFLHKS